MATMLQAVNRFGPKVVYGSPVKIDELADLMARSSGLNANAAQMALAELKDAILFYLKRGSPVVIPGLGRFKSTMGRDGELRLHFVPERRFTAAACNADTFRGKTARTETATWTDEEYKAAWDAEFPDDPLVLPAGRGTGTGEGPLSSQAAD
jgi:hypothetical protein